MCGGWCGFAFLFDVSLLNLISLCALGFSSLYTFFGNNTTIISHTCLVSGVVVVLFSVCFISYIYIYEYSYYGDDSILNNQSTNRAFFFIMASSSSSSSFLNIREGFVTKKRRMKMSNRLPTI